MVEILKLKFGQDFEAGVWSGFYGFLKLKFGRDSEAESTCDITITAVTLMRALYSWVNCAFGNVLFLFFIEPNFGQVRPLPCLVRISQSVLLLILEMCDPGV